ncbi:hypothetical protein C789_1682 [Microcystis aeruginosa FACHB-905 = DIANCHI905]|uniref:Uncharacterized protein n=1 Tax=Microcystis aeruginosa PCC 7806SL TaxID=1903187 RepID=A0AB33BT89_MICA7|nr:hypothetical protein BH695_3361 [Microcystis aeruginosa PCC 7806SL]ELS48542.1 hypothetical protein C789_1682 [Microcystis aeruginosa FACHB-905 = DIANCHI905]
MPHTTPDTTPNTTPYTTPDTTRTQSTESPKFAAMLQIIRGVITVKRRP